MADIPLIPVSGMNNVSEDAALQRETGLFVREAVNIDISAAGRVSTRRGVEQVSPVPYRNLWQSPLHGDTFGTLGDRWVKVDLLTWTHEELAQVGVGDVAHEILNNAVSVATPAGIFVFDGSSAKRLTLDTPAAPWVTTGSGSLEPGTYGVAVAWLRGTTESATSPISSVEVPAFGAMDVTLPLCLDGTVTGARLYLTRQNGGELARAGDYALGASINIPLLPELGRPPAFRHLSPMPTGKYLKHWRGRILTAKANVLRWSESLAYHIHNERHGFVQMPQRVTFILPVDGGIWVGQVDHVAFLEGASPDSLSLVRKKSLAPVPGSAIEIDAETLGAELSQGGAASALWLAANGYVVGTASGQVIELHAGQLKGISGSSGTSVVLDRRLFTAVI